MHESHIVLVAQGEAVILHFTFKLLGYLWALLFSSW